MLHLEDDGNKNNTTGAIIVTKKVDRMENKILAEFHTNFQKQKEMRQAEWEATKEAKKPVKTAAAVKATATKERKAKAQKAAAKEKAVKAVSVTEKKSKSKRIAAAVAREYQEIDTIFGEGKGEEATTISINYQHQQESESTE